MIPAHCIICISRKQQALHQMLEEDSRQWIIREQMQGFCGGASSTGLVSRSAAGHDGVAQSSRVPVNDLLALALSSYSPSTLASSSAAAPQSNLKPGAISDTMSWSRNKWEVDRLLAARDCLGLSRASPGISNSERGKVERWLVALRLPRDASLPLIQRGSGGLVPVTLYGSDVLRARSALMVKVHPDKCDPSDAKRASEAFSFLQESTAGLLEIIGNH